MTILEVVTHSGERVEVEVEEYNAQELNNKINDHDINTIALGDHIFSRIEFKFVRPVKKETELGYSDLENT
ncbi:hypothetical protein [Alkalicoccobacillus porphyridii]|uniref:Uncharacterized protein n=1 Tax=Alkalicoccobacillus porphyridii TaxID=2597270 RepID=A0A554A097_9BACI|nr:hypothetical protein [Alkalicoccobacillus porphyridii]TSB47119.1 hypothetical protein FN960_08885 [Alkalicoccobacillus porphyridii]